jgi:D-aminopeptidase
MHCFQFKGGIGTSSRKLPDEMGGWTIGVLAQTNFGRRPRLTIAGVPVGQHLPHEGDEPADDSGEQGSGIVIVATDAPLDGRQLARVAKRAALGLGRTGSYGGNGSGELLMAFSTGYRPGAVEGLTLRAEVVEGNAIDPIFAAAIDATEESVYNALCMATTTVGRRGNTLYELPLETLRELLQRYGRG